MIDVERDFSHLNDATRRLLTAKLADAPPFSLSTSPPKQALREVEEPQRDCVRCFPNVDPDVVTLVGFDSQGEAQIEIRMRRARLSPQWEERILRWVRQWDHDRLRLVK